LSLEVGLIFILLQKETKVTKILRYSNTKEFNLTGQTNSAKVFSREGNSPD